MPQSIEDKCNKIMNLVESCFEENSEADDVASATTRCFFRFDRHPPLDVNCTAADPSTPVRARGKFKLYTLVSH